MASRDLELIVAIPVLQCTVGSFPRSPREGVDFFLWAASCVSTQQLKRIPGAHIECVTTTLGLMPKSPQQWHDVEDLSIASRVVLTLTMMLVGIDEKCLVAFCCQVWTSVWVGAGKKGKQCTSLFQIRQLLRPQSALHTEVKVST